MERVDELTVTFTHLGGTPAFGLALEAKAGADLFELAEQLIEHVVDLDVPELPRVLVHHAGLTRQGPSTTIESRIALPDDFTLDLRKLPLVGQHADAQLTFEELGVKLTHTQGEGWGEAHIGGKVRLSSGEPDEQVLDLALPLRTGKAAEQPVAPAVRSGRTFGPLTVDSIAVDLRDNALRVRLNARVGYGRVAVEVIGLQASIPLDCPAAVRFSIDGLAVKYDIPPITVSGGLLIVGGRTPRRYDGSLAVRAGEHGLAAIGSYAETDPPSLLAFLQVLVPIGGPPYLYVNRVSGGFGINRELELPPIETLETFPLIAGFDEDWEPARPGAVDSALRHIDEHLSPLGGGHWLAAGVGVASFGLVSTQALLTLAFHGRVEIGVLGRATLEFPPLGPKVVSARMALRTVVSPSVGEFSARGQLAPASYVLDRDCRLTGGFAFCMWFNPHLHAGDFVVTLGGYHPAFKAPAHYPTVPRLGVAWTPPGIPLKLRGTQYFALTPGLVMTGGLLEANWDKGPLRARFTIQADFLVGWAPFHYEAELGVTFSLEVNLGTRLKHTVCVNVGAHLRLWGPPFSGQAQIDFGVMSFAIEFGADAPSRPEFLEWPEFQDQLLGEHKTLLRLRVRDGLLSELAKGRYAVDAERFEAASELRVPANRVLVSGAGEDAAPFDIAPMDLERGSFESVHELRVQQWTAAGWADYGGFESVLQTGKGAPKALWERQAKTLRTALDGDGTIDGLLTGVRLKPSAGGEPEDAPVPWNPVQRDEAVRPAWRWDKPDVRPRAACSDEDGRAVLADTILAADVAAAREAIVGRVLGPDVPIDVGALTTRARLGLRAAPRLAAVGER